MRTPPPRLPGHSPEPPDPRPLPEPGPGRPRPRPDIVVRLVLPAAGPPYDDQDPPRPPGGGAAAAGGPAPADQSGPAGLAVPPRLAVWADGADPDGRPGSGDQVGPGLAGDSRSGPWTSLLAQALVEALAGSRAPRQIAPWTTEQARRRIRQIGPLLPAGQRPVVRRVLTSAPRRDVVEMTVIVSIGPLTRAIAVRLERAPPSPARPDRGRPWLCTVIEAA
jgi:Family of unknown function (DUF6459)